MARFDDAHSAPLRDRRLADRDSRVHVLSCEHNRTTASICHVDVGGVRSAQQVAYTDGVPASGDLPWGICDVGITQNDAAMEAANSCVSRELLRRRTIACARRDSGLS